MNVRFSKLSAYKLRQLTEYLREEWGNGAVSVFLDKLDRVIQAMSTNPKMYQTSQYDKNLRRGVITKQTAILYEVRGNMIFILNIIDNRQHPDKISKEIKNLRGGDK